MGHQTRSDLEAVFATAERVWDVAQRHIFPGEAEFLLDLPELALESSSFRVEFRLQQDALGWDNELQRTMIALRFGPAGMPLPDNPWTVYVHGDWRERTDRLPRRGPLRARRLRKALSPKRRSPDDPHRDAAKSDDLYLMQRTPTDDITAQVCIFVLQTELSTDNDASLFRWLADYFINHFKLPTSEPRELAEAMVAHMLEHKWYAENPRAWRKYVARVRDGLRRGGITTSEIEAHATLFDDRNVEDRLIERVDAKRKRNNPDFGDGQRWTILHASLRPYDPNGGVYTVDEVVAQTDMARSTLYSRIERGRIAAGVDAKGRRVISRSEVERLRKTPPLSGVVKAVASARRTSESTARKYVFRLRRRGWSLEEILRKWGS